MTRADLQPSSARARAADLWICAIVVLMVFVCSGWFLYAEYRIAGDWGFSLDDSWIYATFARNIATGHGYSFNPGERIAGATGPLYALILALLYRVFHNIVWSAKLFGIGCLAASSVLMVLAMSRLQPRSRLPRLVAGLLVGISPSLVWGAVSGMEIPLYLLLVCLGIHSYVKERWTLAAIYWSLGVWVRPDGLLLALMGIFLRPKMTVKNVAVTFLAVAPVLAAFFTFNYVVGGHFMPNSVLTKTHFGQSVPLRAWEMMRQWAAIWGLSTRPSDAAEHSLVLFPAMIVGAVRLGRRLPAVAIFILALPLALAAFGASGGAHGRYIMPVIPFGVLLGVVGLDYLCRRAFRKKFGPALVVLTLVCVAWQVRAVERKGRVHGWNVENINDMQRLLAENVRRNASPGDTIAVNDVGAMGYFSGCYVVDLMGLVSPLRSFPDNLRIYRPKYVVVFPSWFKQFLSADPQTKVMLFYDPDSTHKYALIAGAGLRFNTISSRDKMLVFARMRREEESPIRVPMTWH